MFMAHAHQCGAKGEKRDMKFIRGTASAMLALALAFSMSLTSASAAGKAALPKGFAGKGTVKISIYAVTGKGTNAAGIRIDNGTKTQSVAGMTLGPRKSTTISTSRSLPVKGIWLNVHETYQPRGTVAYATKIVSSASFRKAMNMAKKSDTWSAKKNSAWFAVRVWNTAGGKKASGGSPSALSNSIRRMKGHGVTTVTSFFYVDFWTENPRRPSGKYSGGVSSRKFNEKKARQTGSTREGL